MSSAASGGGLSALAIRRPVFTTMVMVGLVVLGIFSYRRLAIDQFPDVDIPVVSVQTIYPGASAETIEREVTRRMGRRSCASRSRSSRIETSAKSRGGRVAHVRRRTCRPRCRT